ncbi:hypothetical protein [Streptomyces sp. NPDC046862]|uniref:oxidoreductase n=1 Tax=Streptomyces sp. NPDC046862 TaxID=3154603 RepID=UPI00345329F9
MAQLNHGGRQVALPAPGADRVSASDVRERLFGTKSSPLSMDELAGWSSCSWQRGADPRGGFDGVQIHAAHGFLLSQFLTPHTDRRTDAYGGTLDNRARLLVEILRGLRSRLGDDYPVLVKMNGTDDLPFGKGATTEELVRVAVRLRDEERSTPSRSPAARTNRGPA